MQVRDVMTRGVECVQPTDTIAHAAEKMKSLHVGSLPVCGENDKLVGMITDRDITVRATAGSCDPCSTSVKDVMTPNIVTCTEDEDVKEAARLMQDKQIRRVVVLNNKKRLVGILSLGDLAVEADDKHLTGGTLEQISAASPQA